MLSERFRSVVRQLSDRLGGTDVAWAVTGSVALALQGVSVEPDDLDVRTDESGAYALERLFDANVTDPVSFSEAPTIRSHYGTLAVDEVTVEIVGDPQWRRPDGTWTPPGDVDPVFVTLDGGRVPVVPLDELEAAYRRLGRDERAARVARRLDSS